VLRYPLKHTGRPGARGNEILSCANVQECLLPFGPEYFDCRLQIYRLTQFHLLLDAKFDVSPDGENSLKTVRRLDTETHIRAWTGEVTRGCSKLHNEELHILHSSKIFFSWYDSPSGPGPPRWRGLMITLRHITLRRASLDEWSARGRDLYLTTHNIHKRHTSMPSAGFEPAIPGSQRPQTHALGRTATGIGPQMLGQWIQGG
jgi:hypothetical protein